MIFVTVGTEYPFDRLIRALDNLASSGELVEEVFAQIGKGGYRPKHLGWIEMLPADDFDLHLKKSIAVISHAGMGTIIRCLELRKPILVMARRAAHGEHVSDHQAKAAMRIAERGDILFAHDESELRARIADLACFSPPARSLGTNAIIEEIRRFLDALQNS